MEAQAFTKSTKSRVYIAAGNRNKGKVPRNTYNPDTLDNVLLLFKSDAVIQRLPLSAAPRDRSQLAPTYLPASCYLAEYLNRVWHRSIGQRRPTFNWLVTGPSSEADWKHCGS